MRCKGYRRATEGRSRAIQERVTINATVRYGHLELFGLEEKRDEREQERIVLFVLGAAP